MTIRQKDKWAYTRTNGESNIYAALDKRPLVYLKAKFKYPIYMLYFYTNVFIRHAQLWQQMKYLPRTSERKASTGIKTSEIPPVMKFATEKA